MTRRQALGCALGLVLAVALLGGGCAQVDYYAQAAQGQFALLSQARPIDDWLADPATGTRLRTKLLRVKQIRQFAATDLGLPDNRSYRSYADLKRPFVLWNVVATPELSMQQQQWCFPVAGCVSYRGYYDPRAAHDYADGLRRAGMDVQVAGVPAYSTLGWFNDPVLSSFIYYPDGELARLVFHELAHQVVYVKDDTQFNESFATAVEEAGVERWLVAQGDPALRQTYLAFEDRKHDFLLLLLHYRETLEANYEGPADVAQKRARKAVIFADLKADYQRLKHAWGGYAGYDRWFAEPLSNAHLAAVATYHDYVPAFRVLLQQEHSFPRFYAAVARLAALDKAQRQQQLACLSLLAAPVPAHATPLTPPLPLTPCLTTAIAGK